MKSIILALGILTFASQAPAATKAELIKASQEAVREQMKDPESARFRNMKVYDITVCGEVNAKNSYGGYNGFKRFFALGGTVARVEGGMDNDAFVISHAQFCSTKAERARQAEKARASAPPAPSDPEMDAIRTNFEASLQ